MKLLLAIMATVIIVGCKGSSGVDHAAVETYVKRAEACKDAPCAEAALAEMAAMVARTYPGKMAQDDVDYVVKVSREMQILVEARRGSAAGSAAAPTTARLSRYELMWTAYTACRSIMVPAKAAPDQVALITQLRDNNAKRLARIGVTWAAYPAPEGDPVKDDQRGMLWYLGAMTELTKHLDGYPDPDKMLVPVGQTVCNLFINYDPASPTLEPTLGALGRLGKFTGLDPVLVTTLTDTLAKKVPAAQGQEAAAAFFKGALQQLNPKP